MDYIITFADVMAALITTGLAVMSFFVKKWFNNIEQGNKEVQKRIDEGNAGIKKQIEKNDEKVNERIDRLEEKTEKDISQIKQEINDIKGDFSTTFVLREDFFRSMNGVEDKIKGMDGKLDRLLMMGRDK